MDDRNVGYAQGIGSSDIGTFADNLAESLDRQMKIAFEPEERKALRRFSSTEVAGLLRVARLTCATGTRTVASRKCILITAGTGSTQPKKWTNCATSWGAQERTPNRIGQVDAMATDFRCYRSSISKVVRRKQQRRFILHSVMPCAATVFWSWISIRKQV